MTPDPQHEVGLTAVAIVVAQGFACERPFNGFVDHLDGQVATFGMLGGGHN